MPIANIVKNNAVKNYINNLNFDMSKSQLRHLENPVTSIISINNKRNITNLSNKILGSKERNCTTKFLIKCLWNRKQLNLSRIKNLIGFI